ncbi:MAG: OprD family outer membrane porin [Sulfurimonas sp.]|uniref:OprD family outer membrane porin n=1 Tax=Sulfurimonas sp. TaxID=2022749 RepID=UPI002609A9F6|nr:OprD family outer membrane porin [Sulfurimonas sp.]MDD2651787.1 OprD family outer membrane porin [Sulfurimonas sp.]MDD3451661.1 OprD family outer membrane porin [Sulfurimonas sp.]
MRVTKLSLIAVLLLGSSAFAIENTKVSGNAKLYYGTQDSDAENAPNLFTKESGYTNFAARLDLTTDLTKGVSAGVGTQVVTTLGVEHNLVDSVWSNAHTASGSTGARFVGGAQVDSAMWFDEVWLAGSAFDTTLKIGRQSLDTPLAFTESWGVDKNTFEAAVLINQSLPGTTLVATFIGKSNGSADDRTSAREGGVGNLNDLGATAAGYVAADGTFSTFGTQGTYAFGVVNNSFKPLTIQAWYYDMVDFAQAYWLQADAKCSKIEGLSVGVQYANTDLDKRANIGGTTGVIGVDTEDTTAWAAMVGYKMKDVATFKAAYSDVDDKGVLGVANTATGSIATAGGQSKLYTEMWWNYGYVSAVGAESFALSAETKLAGVDFLLGYYNADIAKDSTLFSKEELTEVALVASKKFGPLDTSLALIHGDREVEDVKTTDIQIYLTYNF